MSRTTLLTTTVFACLVVASGCERGARATDPPPKTSVRTTTIGTPAPAQRTVDPAPMSVPKPAEPKPAMTTPPVEGGVEIPASLPAPPPAAPRTPPRRYKDGCRRPLVA